MSVSPSRRTVLKGAAVLAVLPVLGFNTERRRSPIVADPFTLGVASGEPSPDGAVIWTWLAPSPLADDGLGGMPDNAVDVEWEVASDEAVLAENPHIRYFSNRRGYARTRITRDELRADFRVVPYVSRPDAPVHTGASFIVPDGEPALYSM